MHDAAAAPSAPALSTRLERIQVRAKFFWEGDRKWFLKGVAYGPFRPNADGDPIATPERAREDFLMMRAMGINLIRIYHVPPRWLLDAAAEHGLRVLISIPWTQHVEFLNSRTLHRQIVETIREAVQRNAGHPAIFGYFVGNEAPSTMVRWLGAGRTIRFLEKLIDVARRTDPRPLYSYASYPPTEYVLPANVDFYSFNVYLERRPDLERYVARLQNLADDKPVILGEFGLDAMRNGEQMQAEVLAWHLEVVVKGGAAGTIFFSWTDEWFTGGAEVEDWAFGLVTRDRTPKKAYGVLKEMLGSGEPVTARERLSNYPRVSVIVCSCNGAATLPDCLRALDEIDYPDFEIVLVDDGSTDGTLDVVKQWQAGRGARAHPAFVFIQQPNMGLGHARNSGAAAAGGEILAYTDCDCMPDADWLYYMAGTLLSGDFAGAGGPNIAPPAANWVQAAVAAAPGGPNHVLLTDVIAEHVPGCNMAFHRRAFESVGGFDPEFRRAGDDVDFCWRLQANGEVVAFSPSAIVWHYRRFTLRGFCRQQEGYGEAEAKLRFKHLIFFGPTGQAKWKGQIYGAPRFAWLFNRPLIYHGVFGQGFFQCVYSAPHSAIAGCLASIEWMALTVFMAVLCIPLERLRIVPCLMLSGAVLVALSHLANARIESRFDAIPARILVGFLAFTQPLVRGWARYFTWLKGKRTPRAVIASHAAYEAAPARGSAKRLDFWNEEGHGREKLLEEIFAMLESEGWSCSCDTGWKDWDVAVYGSFWWSVRLATVTEYHGGSKCLTRVRLSMSMAATAFIANGIVLSVLLHRLAFTSNADLWLWGLCAVFVIYLWMRARKLRSRLGELVVAAAAKIGLSQIGGAQAKPKAAK